MDRVYRYLLIVFILLNGCTSDNESWQPNGDNELGVSAICLNLSTRAMTESFTSGNSVGVFVTGTGYTRKISHYTYDGSLWAYPSDYNERIYLLNEPATVYGIYPSNVTLVPIGSDGINWVNTENPSQVSSLDGSAQTDYMYATGAYDSGSKSYPLSTAYYAPGKTNVALYFHHALTKIVFIINKEANYTGIGQLEKIEFNGTNGKTFYAGSGLMNAANGEFNISGLSNSLEFAGSSVINEYNDSDPSTKVTSQILVLPVSSTSDMTVSFTIDGTIMTASLPTGNADKWEPGKQYIYNVGVSGTGLEINNVSILDWDDVISGSVDTN